MKVKVKSIKKLREMMRNGEITIGLPGGQGDMDENMWIGIGNHYFPHDPRTEEYLVVDHWHSIPRQVYEKFSCIFEDDE